VDDGEFVSILGPSGCGKSTLLRIVDGLVPASSGEVLINGTRVQGSTNHSAMVFQDSSLFPWFSVLDNVAYGLVCRGVANATARLRAQEYVNLVGLAGFQSHYPHELSGGMQQRVNLARALAVEPQLLLMDEPFASLDAQTREVMQRELLSIWQSTRKAVIFVTHQIDEAVYLSDRVLVMSARPGRLLRDIPIDLPRPRELAVKRQQGFQDHTDQIWQIIEDEVNQTIALEKKLADH
jgi:NitT/TauT family transport system ATP-binding protein